MTPIQQSLCVLCIILAQTLLISPTPVVTDGSRHGEGNDKIAGGLSKEDQTDPLISASAWSFNSGSEDDDDWSWKKHNLGVDDQYSRSAK